MINDFLQARRLGIETMLKNHDFSPNTEINLSLASVWQSNTGNTTYKVTVPDNSDISRSQAVSCDKWLKTIACGDTPRIAHMILGKTPYGEYHWTP